MRRIPVMICASLLLLCSAHADDPKPAPDPALLKAEKALRAVLADVEPAPSFEFPDYSQTLVVKYRTRKFMVHTTSMIGKHSQKAREVEGPSYLGFQLEMHLQKAGTVNQAVVPQTLRRPYWETALDVTVIPGTDKQFYWSLSYGSRVQRDLLKLVKDAIKNLAKKG
ncbi:MAG: hypothetical protein GY842_06505 [bacterium]|nr:hypothetical protein [bacterium]